MFVVRFEDLPDYASTEDKLDVAVNRECMAFYIASMIAPSFDEQGSINDDSSQIFNNALLRMVYVTDARACCDEETYSANEELAYLAFAKAGLQRLAGHLQIDEQLDGINFFSEDREDLQVRAYNDALNRHMPKPQLLASLPLRQYAELVALDEVRRSMTTGRQLAAPHN